jgi:PKD repeat protein
MNVVHPFTWDFGDPTSGVNNTSNAHFPIHNFTAPGTYTVTLTVQNDCDGYTVAQQVTITNNVPVIPTVALVGIHLESSVGQNYQWYFNGNTIVGATNQTYSPLQSGYYSVLVTDSNGCLAQSQEFYFAVTNLNQKLVAYDLKVIPNPAQQSISIVSNKFISNISIVDMAGRMVIQSAENKNIDVSFLNSGIYFLQANSNNEIIRTKFVKN